MTLKCRLCKKRDHHISNCNSDKKIEIIEKIENQLLKTIEFNYDSEFKFKDIDYEKVVKTMKTFKHIEIILLALKNNIPINLSRYNYEKIFYDIYLIKKIKNNIDEDVNINKIYKLEDSIYEIVYSNFENYMFVLENNKTYIKDKINGLKDEKDIKLLFYKYFIFENFKYYDIKYQISFLINYYTRELINNTNSTISKTLKEMDELEKYRIRYDFEKVIFENYDNKFFYDLINKKTLIKKNEIKNYVKKNINKLYYIDLFTIYNYYFNNNNQIYYLDNIEYINILRNILIDHYSYIIYDKIKKSYNTIYNIDENIELIENTIISTFFLKFYQSNIVYTEGLVPHILKKIIYTNTEILDDYGFMLLGHKNKICNFDIFFNEYSYINIFFNFYSLYIQNILNYLLYKNDLKEVNLTLFSKSIRESIYFYYALICVKIRKWNIENIIDNLYESDIMNENTNEKNILKNSIENFIKLLIDNKYKFTRESIYFIKVIKKYVDKKDLKYEEDDDLNCPICFEKFEIENIIINSCKHKLCKNCFDYMYSKSKPYITIQCCICRRDINEVYMLKSNN